MKIAFLGGTIALQRFATLSELRTVRSAMKYQSKLSPHSFIECSQSYCDAAVTLCNTNNQAIEPIGLLSAHSLEIALKAMLSHMGWSEPQLRSIGHDLEKLWSEAAPFLEIDKSLPEWVRVLNFSHRSPYHFRYPSAEFQVAIPECQELTQELRKILEMVALRLT
jgi:hypothetical protein